LRDFAKGSRHCFFAINLQTRETISLDGEYFETSPEFLEEEAARTAQTVD
jgi:hypothetical protein